MRPPTKLLPFLLLLLLLPGCASGPSQDRGPYDILQGPEIERVRDLNALQAVQRLRPRWLRVRGQDSVRNPSGIVVYLNDSRQGGVDSLASIPMAAVEEMRFLDAREATTRFGTGNAAGAILVSTR